MLTKLHIKNFKTWADTGEIRLAPITVFFGTNSSGKSSLIQFLLMLKQTAESPDRRRILHPGDQTTPVELGTFRDLVYKHDLSREIEFELESKLPKPLHVSDPINTGDNRFDLSASRLNFQAKIKFEEMTPRIQSLQYTLTGEGGSGDNLCVSMKQSGSSQKFDLEASPYKVTRNPGRAWKLPAPVRFYGFPDEVNAYYQNAGFTSDLTLALEQELRRIQYLGPLRTIPRRSYVWSGEVPDHVGWTGSRAVEALLAAHKRSISPGYKKRAKPFQEVIATWLREMGLLKAFEVKPIAANRKEYEVLVQTPSTGTSVTLADVGFGVSQVLPVIVECFYASPYTTILMEQPEIHLHPAVQSSLADLFIETVSSREDSADRKVQVIVESHSEHFLRRLQRRVAEGKIRTEDVALYFCQRTDDGAVMGLLHVDLFGSIENWPKDFFGNEMEEITARLNAAAERAL